MMYWRGVKCMTENERREKIENAIDTCLADMKGDPWLAQRVKNSAEGSEKIVKKKISTAMILAIVLVIVGATALAATLYPRTADRFAENFGKEFGEHLNQGDTAQVGTSYTLGDVQYTVTDVIWADGRLYGTVVAEPAEGANVVLMTMDEMEGEGVNSLSADGTKTYLQLAQEKNAKLLEIDCMPKGYVLDGKTFAGDIGVFYGTLEDGNPVVSFEMSGLNGGIERADAYQLVLLLRSWEVSQKNERAADGERFEWTVEAAPEMKETKPETVTQLSASGIPVVLPADYNGQMNVYKIAEKNITIDPTWFNTSGIAEEEHNRGYSRYVFKDEDELNIDVPCYAFYYAYQGTETVTHILQKGKTVDEIHPRAEAPEHIASLVSWLHFEDKDENPVEKLTNITLQQAQSQAEALLQKLGVEDAVCIWRYGADLATIQALNEEENQKILSGKLLNSNPWNDPFTTADEGYYLVYAARVDGMEVNDQFLEAGFFVNQDGVRHAYIRAPYTRGEALSNEKLITADEALSKAVYAGKKSWIPEMGGYFEKAVKIELIYAVKGTDQLVPAWRVTAIDPEKDCDIVAIVSAVTGDMLDAPWM